MRLRRKSVSATHYSSQTRNPCENTVFVQLKMKTARCVALRTTDARLLSLSLQFVKFETVCQTIPGTVRDYPTVTSYFQASKYKTCLRAIQTS